MLRRFELHRATTIDEAIALRARFGDDAAIYAGGIERTDGVVRIGATVTHWELERDAIVRRELPAFARLETNVANVRVRAAGTLAGNLAFAEPHADPPAFLLAADARVVIRGERGERRLAIDEFVN